MKSVLRTPIERMLQGLAYWLSYRDVVSKNKVVELVAVDEATQIFQLYMPSGYKVKNEYGYNNIDASFGNQRADLAVVNDQNKCECLIEFKLSENTAGGYKKDVDKLRPVKEKYPDIDCYVVILYRKSCRLGEPKELVLPNGKARRKRWALNKAMITVRRVYTSLRSQVATRMKRVICVELV